MADINGQAEVVEEVCSDDGHKYVGHHELPSVPLGAVVQRKLLVSIRVDGGAVGSLHSVESLPLMPSHVTSGDERASSASIDQILDLGFWVFEDERRSGRASCDRVREQTNHFFRPFARPGTSEMTCRTGCHGVMIGQPPYMFAEKMTRRLAFSGISPKTLMKVA